MGLESPGFINSLNVAWPLSTDPQRQGDDHLRNLKTTLRNTFPRASKAFYFSQTAFVSNDRAIVVGEENTIFTVNGETALTTLTLPELGSQNAGWCMYYVKTVSDTQAAFIVPSSGTINGFAKLRRAVPFVPIKVLWTGSIWVADRAFGIPIGAGAPYTGTLPRGMMAANGGSFVAADFPELNSVLGGTVLPNYNSIGGTWGVVTE